MKYEDVLLPRAPLFSVHKDWSSREQQATAESTRRDIESSIPDSGHDNGNGNGRPRTLGQPQNSASSGKRKTEKGAAKASGEKHSGASDTAGHFQFVNTTRPDRPQDPAFRKLVMSYVKTGVKRGPNTSKRPRSKSKSKSTSPTNHSGPNIDAITERGSRRLKTEARISPLHTPVSGASSPFYGNVTFSLPTGPRFELLLSYYLHELASTWYPLEDHLAYNPVREGWFRLAMTDEVCFRSILLSSATHLDRKNGNRNHQEVASLALPILHHVNERLREDPMPSDATISIVSCLAMAELSGGNLENWKVHMAAIKEMVFLRGGINNLGAVLQIKITRADVEGASETVTIPNLQPPQRSSSPNLSSLPDPNSLNVHASTPGRTRYRGISSEIQSILQELSQLNQALCHAVARGETTVDPRPLDENIIHIHHRALRLLAPAAPAPARPPSPTSPSAFARDLDEATAIVALLFAKSLSRGAGPTGPRQRPIIQRLRSLLARIHTSSMPTCSEGHVSPPVSPRLLLWLHFMGGVVARGSGAGFFEESIMLCLTLCGSRTWDSGGATLGPARLPAWQDVKGMLGDVLWFPPFHDEPGISLWNKVVLWSQTHSRSGKMVIR